MHWYFAIIFLAIVLLAVFLEVYRAYRKKNFSPFQFFLFCIATLLIRLQWRADLPRTCPLPPGQGAVIVCNHRSSIDPFFFQYQFADPLHWMVAKEYCDHPLFGWFLRACEVIPTNRAGIDTAATKMAIRLAASGEIVGMFPEGRINRTEELMLPARAGAVMVALKAQVPILPCYISGSPYGGKVWSPFFMTARVKLRWGSPIDLSDYFGKEVGHEVFNELMLRCMREIAKIAGCENFQPKLAGRNWKPEKTENPAPVVDR